MVEASSSSSDPLGYRAVLNERAEFPLLGKPLLVLSNDRAVIAAAERVFGQWRNLEPGLVENAAPLVIRVVVHGDGVSAGPTARPIYRLHADTLLAASGDDLFSAQLDRGIALAFVSLSTATDILDLRYQVLEGLGLVLASWHHQDRLPVHAGAVLGKKRAVVLAGPSGAGKSTLCYACWRAGLRLMGEDAIYVSLAQGLQLWGNPGPLHLLPDAPLLFPELAGLPPSMQPNGEVKLTVDTSQGGHTGLALHADGSTAICLLERHDGERAELTPVAPDIISDRMSREIDAGGGIFTHYLPSVIARLAQGGAYVLKAGRDLDAAVDIVRMLSDR